MGRVVKFATAWAEFVVKRRWWVIVTVLAGAAALATGMGRLSFNDNYRVYFSPQNPDLMAWEQLLDTYSRTDGLTVVLERTDGKKIFSKEVMPLVVELTARLWHVPYVTRVDSVSNFQHLSATGDEIVVKDLVPKENASDESFLRQRAEFANSEPHIKRLMLSDDGTVTAMYLELMIPEQGNAIEHVTEYVRHLKEEIEKTHKGVRLRFGGLVMLNSAVDEYSRADVQKILPLMMLTVVVVLFLVYRSLLATIATLVAVFMTIAATMGTAGYLGITLSPHSSIAPQVMLTVAIATTMHMVVSFLRYLHLHSDRKEAIVKAMQQNMLPIALTCLTTGIGFASMLLSDVPPFQHIGIICGVGMIYVFIVAVLFLPALVSVLPFRVYHYLKSASMERHWTTRLGAMVIDNRGKILLGTVLLTVPLAWGMTRLEISDHPVRLFAQGTEFRDDADFIDEHLAGTTDIQFSLQSGKPYGINDPAFLHDVDRLKNHLLADPLVNHVKVITNTVKRINKAMHGGDPAYYRLPDDQDSTAQYLLFYEMNLPFGMELNNQIDVSKSAVRLIATVRSSSSREVTDFLDRTHDWVAREVPSFHTRGVSVLVMFAYMAHRAANSMFLTAFVAMFAIGVVLMMALRSVRLGLLSLVPNLLPILIVFGIWSLAGRSVDIAASLIFSMTLGVVVDDTVHFLNKFFQAFRDEGRELREAIIAAYQGVGPAMLYSTVTLVLGFSVFLASGIKTNSTLGVLTALTFLVALILDLVLLPILLYFVLHRRETVVRAAAHLP